MHIKHRFILIGLLVLLLVSAFAIASGAGAQGPKYGCVAFAADLRNDDSIPHTATIYFGDIFSGNPLTPTNSLTLLPGQTGTLRLVAQVPLPVYLGGGPGGLTVLGFNPFGAVISVDNCIGGSIGDGRINDGANQLAAPVAVYCAFGNIDVYLIDAETGVGELVISVPQAGSAPPASGAPTPGNNGTQLASGGGVVISLLADGRYLLQTLNFEGNPYIIAWQGCDGRTLDYIAPQPTFN